MRKLLLVLAGMALAQAPVARAQGAPAALCQVLRAAQSTRRAAFEPLKGEWDSGRGGWRARVPGASLDCLVEPAADGPAQVSCLLPGAALRAADAAVAACLPGWRRLAIPDAPAPRLLFLGRQAAVMLTPRAPDAVELRAW